jgi:multicomponent K+:H+ antiporter subunit G
MDTLLEFVISALLVTGAAFALLGSFGLAKLSDFFRRLHGPTKATTLGVGAALIASSLWFSTRGAGLSLHELLITLFLVLTAPVSAQQLARAALRRREPPTSATSPGPPPSAPCRPGGPA